MSARILLLSACLLCSGCMAAGTQVQEAQLTQFHKGHTTTDQVTSALGDPNSNTILPDGSRLLCYTYVQATVRPETFIPIVGGFVGGADTHSNATCFQFAENGIMKGYTATTSQAGSGTMFASGVHQVGRVQEPRSAE
jgi:hypothetical protein